MKKKQLLIWGILVFQYAISLAQSIPDYPIAQGVSAPFAGFIKDWLIVGGGLQLSPQTRCRRRRESVLRPMLCLKCPV